VVTISKAGLIKKSDLSELPGPSSQSFILTKVNDGDELCQCMLVSEEAEYFVATRNGLAIRFSAEEVRSMGLIAAGVNAIKLGEGDQVVGMTALKGKGEITFVTSAGNGWRISEVEFPLQKRYGQGVIIGKLKPQEAIIGLIYGIKSQPYTVFLAKSVAKTLKMDAIVLGKRASVMKTLFSLKPTDCVTGVMTAQYSVTGNELKPIKIKKQKEYRQDQII
jgi:DNA gyrase subunit A